MNLTLTPAEYAELRAFEDKEARGEELTKQESDRWCALLGRTTEEAAPMADAEVGDVIVITVKPPEPSR